MAKRKDKPQSREPRDSKVTIPLTPIDVRELGSENDPCFGKLWDLSAPECQLCGDIEFCAIAFQRKHLLARTKAISEIKTIDALNSLSAENQTILAHIEKLRGMGLSETVVRIKTARKFNKDTKFIKTLM